MGIRFFNAHDVVDQFPPHFGMTPRRLAPGEALAAGTPRELTIVLAGAVVAGEHQIGTGGFWITERGEEVTATAGPDGATVVVSGEMVR